MLFLPKIISKVFVLFCKGPILDVCIELWKFVNPRSLERSLKKGQQPNGVALGKQYWQWGKRFWDEIA